MASPLNFKTGVMNAAARVPQVWRQARIEAAGLGTVFSTAVARPNGSFRGAARDVARAAAARSHSVMTAVAEDLLLASLGRTAYGRHGDGRASHVNGRTPELASLSLVSMGFFGEKEGAVDVMRRGLQNFVARSLAEPHKEAAFMLAVGFVITYSPPADRMETRRAFNFHVQDKRVYRGQVSRRAWPYVATRLYELYQEELGRRQIENCDLVVSGTISADQAFIREALEVTRQDFAQIERRRLEIFRHSDIQTYLSWDEQTQATRTRDGSKETWSHFICNRHLFPLIEEVERAARYVEPLFNMIKEIPDPDIQAFATELHDAKHILFSLSGYGEIWREEVDEGWALTLNAIIPKESNMEGLVQYAAAAVLPIARDNKVKIDIHTTDACRAYRFGRERAQKDAVSILLRHITEIMRNGIRYHNPHVHEGERSLSVAVHKDKDDFVFTVRDNGRGLSEHDLGHIGTPGFRGENAGQVIGSSGYGLSGAFADIKQYLDGSIQVKSTVNQGSTFTIRIPIERLAGSPDQTQSKAEKPRPRRNPLRGALSSIADRLARIAFSS